MGFRERLTSTNLKDCFIIEPKRFGDERGYFESITKEDLRSLGFKEIHQISNSLSSKGIFRGLHYQKNPYCQAKVVRCHRGAVLDIVVDIRQDSDTYGKYTAVELTPENGRALYVPRGFAHGFLALEDDSLFEYYVDNMYMPRLEGGIAYDDSEIGIDFTYIKRRYNISEIKLSEKDKNRISLKDCEDIFYRRPRRFLITGYKGQLGFDIARELKERGEEQVLAIDKEEMDITDRDQVFKVIGNFKPDVIFHCAAWTQVDKAEDMYDIVHKINTLGTKYITEASIEVGAKIFYMSTDYVFDGKLPLDKCYTETDPVYPMNAYGGTKFLGEQEVLQNPKHFITRISWVFGINGNNFVKTMLRLGSFKQSLLVVKDQIGSPTYTVDLAKLLVEMSFTEKYGLYHVNNDGYCSWAEFADFIMKYAGYPCEIRPVSTEYYIEATNTKQAYRPRNSKLSKAKLVESGFQMLPSWQDATIRFCEELKNQIKP